MSHTFVPVDLDKLLDDFEEQDSSFSGAVTFYVQKITNKDHVGELRLIDYIE